MHAPLRQNMAFNLKAVIAQKLLPTTKELAAKGISRVPTNEIMRTNPTIRKLILTEEDTKLGDAIRIGKEEGMQDFTESLKQLVQAEKIERATAFEVAPNVEQLENGPEGDQRRPAGYSVSDSDRQPGDSDARRGSIAVGRGPDSNPAVHRLSRPSLRRRKGKR